MCTERCGLSLLGIECPRVWSWPLTSICCWSIEWVELFLCSLCKPLWHAQGHPYLYLWVFGISLMVGNRMQRIQFFIWAINLIFSLIPWQASVNAQDPCNYYNQIREEHCRLEALSNILTINFFLRKWMPKLLDQTSCIMSLTPWSCSIKCRHSCK